MQFFDYIRLENVSISFNGGKDCTVMLYLLLECYLTNTCKLQRLNIDRHPTYPKANDNKILKGFYVYEENQFEEIEQFISDVEQRYSKKLNLERIHNVSDVKQGLRVYLNIHHNIKAIFVGTRKSDFGNGGLEFIQSTDPDWPQVIRIHPILCWTFQDVWMFIRTMSIPYCHLYDKGFTSIGTKDTTVRHPSLGDNEPADLLPPDQNERGGRKPMHKHQKMVNKAKQV